MNRPLYFDHNATSRLRPQVREKIVRFLEELPGNPSSIHSEGRRARRALDAAREEVARLIGASPSEIVFTSGGTEANHLAWNAFSSADTTIVTSVLEHPSVADAAERARNRGARLSAIGARRDGSLESVAPGNARFLSIQHANNETGVIHPIASWPRESATIVHSDAVQTVGKIPLNVNDLGVHLMTISGHKLGALAGTGALYIRNGTSVEPIWGGGHQENGARTGTQNLLGIVAMGEACRVLREANGERERVENLRLMFETRMRESISGIHVTGETQPRLPNTSHMIFEDLEGESLMIAADLEGICFSTGSACASGAVEPSPVLAAMGYARHEALGSVRFSFGWDTTEHDIDHALTILPRLVNQVRAGGKARRSAG